MSSYNDPRYFASSGMHAHPQQEYPRPGVQVQIPRMPQGSTYQSNFQPVTNGYVAPIQFGYPPQGPGPQYQPPQVQVRILPPTPNSVGPTGFVRPEVTSITPSSSEVPVDYPMLVLSLAEDYFAAAFGDSSGHEPAKRETRAEAYYKLIATGLSCLEVVLREFRLLPKVEAATRFRYATILYQETENYVEAEEALSQGISLCDRHRFLDMKYNMQHLLAHVMFATNARASLKFLDGLIKDVEAYRHVAWIYAFRFLRAALSLKMATAQETLAAIGHLKVTASLANSSGDHAISAVASTMEAMTHLHRANSVENIEQAQRALAAARSSQFDPTAQGIPQLTSMMQFVDICCSLQHTEPPQAIAKMQALQKMLDTSQNDPNWTDDGLVPLPVSPTTSKSLHDSGTTGGAIRTDSRGVVNVLINWLPKEEVYALGYLLSAVVLGHRNAVDGQKSEQYLNEAKRMVRVMLEPGIGSLSTATSRYLWRHLLHCQIQIHLIFALCSRSSYTIARSELTHLKELAASLPSSHASLVTPFATYLDALVCHSTGDLSTALSIFLSPPFALSALTPTTPSAQKALTILSALNAVLILIPPTHPQHALLPPLLAQLDPLTTSHPSANIRTAYHLIRATSDPSIVKTKQFLQLALQGSKACANNQLMTIVLNFMSWKFFRGSVGEQAEKSARASVQLAKKGRDTLWASVADGVLAETLEARGKGEEADTVRTEGIEIAGRLGREMIRYAEERVEDVREDGDTIYVAGS